MQRLFNIIQLFKEYFVLASLIVVSLILLAENDNAQIRAIRSYTVGFVGILQNTLSVIPNIIELRRENEILRQLNVNLSDEVSRLREARLENLQLRKMLQMIEHGSLQLVAADVVGKSLRLLRNTITLNIGEREGVKADMPIVSESGLVGKIITSSSHYSVGQLLLNKDFRASAKVQRSRVDGIIAWDGADFLHLRNVVKTSDVKEGDVVTTSEYSNTFPRDIKIGSITKVSQKPGNLFKEIEVAPAVDFTLLEQVFVILSAQDSERAGLEKKTVPSR